MQKIFKFFFSVSLLVLGFLFVTNINILLTVKQKYYIAKKIEYLVGAEAQRLLKN